METSKVRKGGIALLFLSFLLALFLVMWRLLVVRIPNGVSTFTLQSYMMFVVSCIGMVLGMWGIRRVKQADFSWLLIVLSVLSISVNGLMLFSTADSWLNPPEVKGIVNKVGDDFISIYLDEEYKEKLDLAGGYCLTDCVDPVNLSLSVGISSRTTFYEQYGKWPWQKKVVSRQNIKEGQHIQIKHNGFVTLIGSIVESNEVIILNK